MNALHKNAGFPRVRLKWDKQPRFHNITILGYYGRFRDRILHFRGFGDECQEAEEVGELERRALLENTERDTIPSDTKEAGSAVVRYIGKIDRGIYKCVTPDITTDEVVITEERIEHCNGHDRAYEKYAEYIGTVLSDPDLILKDTRPHTGIVVRRIDVNGKSLQLVLRLHTSQDDPDYRNSILSFWDISESRRRNYESLYKRDGFGYNIDASEDL